MGMCKPSGGINKSIGRLGSLNRRYTPNTRTDLYNENGECAEDLAFGDKTEDDLRALVWISWADFYGYTSEDHRSAWEIMCTDLFSRGDLQAVILDMIDHFMDGSGTSYSNPVLTQHAYEHEKHKNILKMLRNKCDYCLTHAKVISGRYHTQPAVGRLTR